MSDSPRWCAKCSTNGYHHTDRCPSNQPSPSPYRFTVSVTEEDEGEWWVDTICRLGNAMWQGGTHATPFTDPAEAREHAAQVLAALHQATMEDNQ